MSFVNEIVFGGDSFSIDLGGDGNKFLEDDVEVVDVEDEEPQLDLDEEEVSSCCRGWLSTVLESLHCLLLLHSAFLVFFVPDLNEPVARFDAGFDALN